MKNLLKYLRDYRKECVLGPLFKLFEALLELIVPLIIAAMIDKGIRIGGAGDSALLVRCALWLGALALAGLAASVTAQYFAAKAAIGFSTRLRHAVFAHIHSLSFSDMDRLGSATLITRLTGDINQVQTGVNLGLRLLLRSPFIVFGAMIMAFTIDARSALIFVIVIAVLFVIVFGIILGAMPGQKRIRANTDRVTAASRENLRGIRVIRAFRREDSEKNRFDGLNEELTRSQLSSGRLTALLNPLTFLVLNAALVLLLKTGAVRIDGGDLSQGQIIALYNYLSQILVELIKLANLIVTLTKSAACANRVSAILETGSTQTDGLRPFNTASFRGLRFEDVSLQYHTSGDAALEHISFSALPGQTIGVIGGTGSGKSSLVNLIPRFYDYTAGSVLLNDVPLPEYRLADLRGAIGVVPQRSSLFTGTIRSNLLWGNPSAPDEDLLRALEVAQASDLLRSKPLGLDEPVQQGGQNFSGGQKQRLAIARALVRKPAILILDDSSSALDYATDAALRRALRDMERPPLTFIVSQRTSSVRFADRILVLDDGSCVGTGTHEELLESCPVYREIHAAQAGEEEAGMA